MTVGNSRLSLVAASLDHSMSGGVSSMPIKFFIGSTSPKMRFSVFAALKSERNPPVFITFFRIFSKAKSI